MAIQQKRRAAIGAAIVVVLAAVAVTVGVLTSGGTPYAKAPKAVLGQSLRPLVLYQRAGHLVTTPHPTVGPNQRALPPITGINPVLIMKKPVISLHVEYARVTPAGGAGWRILLLASEGTSFNGRTTNGQTFVTVIDGKTSFVSPLYEVNGYAITAADSPQFQLGNAWPTQAAALAVARSLTTSVTVAHCTQAQIDKYRCE